MKGTRSWLVFLAMLLIAVCVVTLAAEKPILETVSALQGKSDGCDWQCVGASSGKTALAAGWKDGVLELRWFTTDGKKLSRQRLTLPEESTGGTITRLLPVREGVAYLGLYGPNAEKLYLYRLNEDGSIERLLATDCVGDSCVERTARTRFSELTYEDGVMSFALWTDKTLDCYLCRETGGMEAFGGKGMTDASVYSVLTWPDENLLRGGAGFITLNARTGNDLAADQIVTQLTQGRGGWYYLDAARLEVCFADAALSSSYRVLTLNSDWNGSSHSLTSVALTREESALMLLDGAVLTLTNGEGTRELTGILHSGTAGLWLSLAKYAGIALAGALVLWLLLCGLRHGYASMAVMRGSLFVALALLCICALRFAVLKPTGQEEALRDNKAAVASVLRAVNAETRLTDDTLETDVARLLESTESGENIRVVRTELVEGAWKSADGRSAETLDGFDPRLAAVALAKGLALNLENDVFHYVLGETGDGTHTLTVSMKVPEAAANRRLYYLLLGSFGLLVFLIMLLLIKISLDLRKISKRMEQISQGTVPTRLRLHTGDELESMASIVNSLGVSLKQQEEERKRVERSYRRFVPEKVLALFGKPSVQDVDKSAFAVRRMAVMTVRFSFPEKSYKDPNNSRLLFDSVNEIIERTTSIAARKNGTVIRFAYDGFDLVMEDGAEAVSTAVAIQQETLSFNETCAQNRLPGVTLHIALDRGDVMLGVVGDATTMTPTTISSCMAATMELLDLCKRLKAGILCTEAIISEQQNYGNRYMGKCLVGGQPVRVYEVFDGDDFNTRRGKANSIEEFAKGVYDLYGGDTAGAKHTFLKLAHNYPMDGGAHYYLHLADRLEHDPSLPCVLNLDRADGGEM